MDTVDSTVKELRQLVLDGKTGRAKHNWGGAGVIVDSKASTSKGDSFYPDAFYVVTDFALEVSWLFEKLRDAFYTKNLLDYCSKEVIFTRLASAANDAIKDGSSKQEICLSVLNEAEKIYSEVKLSIVSD